MRWIARGGVPRISVANQLTTAAPSARIPHSVSQTRCGSASRGRKKTVETAAPQIAAGLDPDRAVADRQRADRRQRVARGIAVGEKQEIGPELGAVGEPVGGEVAEAARHPPPRERREPAQKGRHREQSGEPEARVQGAVDVGAVAGEDGDQEHRRNGEDDPEGDAPAVLAFGRVDLEVDRVPGPAQEAWKRPGDEVEVGEGVGRIPDEPGEEAVQRRRRAAQQQSRDPVDQGYDARDEGPGQEPDHQGKREQIAEEDGRAVAAEVVGDRQSDWTDTAV